MMIEINRKYDWRCAVPRRPTERSTRPPPCPNEKTPSSRRHRERKNAA